MGLFLIAEKAQVSKQWDAGHRGFRQSESWMLLKNILYWRSHLCPHGTWKFHSLNIIYTRIRFQTQHTTHCIPPVWSLEQKKLRVRSVQEHQSDQSNITFPFINRAFTLQWMIDVMLVWVISLWVKVQSKHTFPLGAGRLVKRMVRFQLMPFLYNI